LRREIMAGLAAMMPDGQIGQMAGQSPGQPQAGSP